MKREQFLDELESRLQGLPKAEIEERINFYDEMIQDIADKLGKLEDIYDESHKEVK